MTWGKLKAKHAIEEKELLGRALERAQGFVTPMAKALGLPYTTAVRLVTEHGLRKAAKKLRAAGGYRRGKPTQEQSGWGSRPGV